MFISRKFPRVVWTEEDVLSGSKKAQILTLRDHIKKSNRRTYFSFVINLINRVSSNSEEKFRKFPSAFWTEEVSFVHISKKTS